MALTPSRADLNAETMAALDVDLMRQMIENNAFGVPEMSTFVQFAASRIRTLEAPSRNAATDEWMASMANELKMFTAQDGDAARSNSKLPWPALLSKAVAWLTSKLDEIRTDMAAAQVGALSQHLKGRAGPAYSRAKFDERMGGAEAALPATDAFIAQALSKIRSSEAARASAVAGGGASQTLVKVLESGLLSLVASSNALRPAPAMKTVVGVGAATAAGEALPETLELDAETLEWAQNTLQATVLTVAWLQTASQVSAMAATAGANSGKMTTKEVSELKGVVWRELAHVSGHCPNLPAMPATTSDQAPTQLRSGRSSLLEPATKLKSPSSLSAETAPDAAASSQRLTNVDTSKETFQTPLERITFIVDGTLSEMVGRRGVQLSKQQRATLRTLVTGMGSDSNRIFSLMKTRSVLALQMMLAQRSDAGGSAITTWLAKNSLTAVEEELRSVAGKISAIAAHSIAVHGDRYLRMIRKHDNHQTQTPNKSRAAGRGEERRLDEAQQIVNSPEESETSESDDEDDRIPSGKSLYTPTAR